MSLLTKALKDAFKGMSGSYKSRTEPAYKRKKCKSCKYYIETGKCPYNFVGPLAPACENYKHK